MLHGAYTILHLYGFGMFGKRLLASRRSRLTAGSHSTLGSIAHAHTPRPVPDYTRRCAGPGTAQSMYLIHFFFCSSVPSQTKLTVRISLKPSVASGASYADPKLLIASPGRMSRFGSSSGP